jgi:WD40 repeat protein
MRLTLLVLHLLAPFPLFAADKLPPGAMAKVGQASGYWRQYPAVVSADGKTLAVRVDGGFDLVDLGAGMAVQLRDDTGKRLLPAKTTRDSGDTYLAFALDGKTVVTANQEKCVSVWDAATGKHLRDVPTPKKEFDYYGKPTDERYWAGRVFGSPHMKGVVVLGVDGQVFVLNAKEEFAKLDCFVSGMERHVTANGRWISSMDTQASVEDTFYVTDVSKKKFYYNAAGHSGGSVGVHRYAGTVATSDDGKLVAASYWDGGKENGLQLHRYDGKGEVKLTDAAGDAFRDAYAVGFSGDAKAVYCVMKEMIATWDTATGKRGKDLALPVKGGVLFDPPRDRAIVSSDGYVYVVDLKK